MITFAPMTKDVEWEWLASRTHAIRCEDTQGIVAYDDHGIAAAAAFDTWTPDACSVHLTLRNPFVLRRGFLSEIAHHLFVVCGRKRIFGLVPANNEKALELDTHIGFREVARIPHGVKEGVDLVIMCMEKDECRWLKAVEEAA